jgi:hypothetical protein
VIAIPDKQNLSPLEVEAWAFAESEAQVRVKLEAALAEAEAARTRAEAEINLLRNSLDTLTQEHERVLNSTIWRATSPIRKLISAWRLVSLQGRGV